MSRVLADFVAKLGGRRLARNNRIGGKQFLNRCCALIAVLESMLPARALKIVLQQNRHISEELIRRGNVRLLVESGRPSERKRTNKRRGMRSEQDNAGESSQSLDGIGSDNGILSEVISLPGSPAILAPTNNRFMPALHHVDAVRQFVSYIGRRSVGSQHRSAAFDGGDEPLRDPPIAHMRRQCIDG